ncbi:MAG: hypothetical protein ACXADB_10135 [Candidatus Hermodarchaeia archaeon]|jgi:hypothetical protein
MMSESEEHIMEVFGRVYDIVRKKAKIKNYADVELTKARADASLVAANLTRTIIEAERDSR